MIVKKEHITVHEWQSLKAFTAARIALGRTGVAIPLKEVLNFKMAHAFARDAVHTLLDEEKLIHDLQVFQLPVFNLQSKAIDRNEYLQRPDWGRILNEQSFIEIQQAKGNYDIAFVIADGLSATAINKHAVPILQLIIPQLQQQLKIAPLIIAQQARVGIGDEIGYLINTKLIVVLIGERPGLSSFDSMGAYITYAPTIGLTDESRNCISNIRPEGLTYDMAAQKMIYLIQQSLQLKLSGVELKDESSTDNIKHPESLNFQDAVE
ncbi:MAG: ethanolamine ammonia-lyase [Chitinophaga sp.]|jgi:ethanolamine ammonia-lyase small subunit|nr:ethanolamine ammonia-lyase [Chitinophaga sp.]